MGLADPAADLLVITARGFGKRTALEEFPTRGRATSGVIGIRLRQNDEVAAAHTVGDVSLLTFITASGVVMRQLADGIPRLGRATQGVTILNLGDGDRVAALSCDEPDEAPDSGDGTQVLVSPNGA
jgi:DNA gyrase subunit A